MLVKILKVEGTLTALDSKDNVIPFNTAGKTILQYGKIQLRKHLMMI